MNKAELIELLEDVEDNEEIWFVDKNNLQYTICDDAYMNNNGIFIKEDYQVGYVEEDVTNFFNR